MDNYGNKTSDVIIERIINNKSDIKYPERLQQSIDFTGLKFGKSKFTNVDGATHFSGKFFAFFETKLEGVEIPDGQEYFYRSLVDALGIRGVYFQTEHNVHNKDKDIVARDTIVKRIRFNGEWLDAGLDWEGDVTLIRCINRWLKNVGLGDCVSE